MESKKKQDLKKKQDKKKEVKKKGVLWNSEGVYGPTQFQKNLCFSSLVLISNPCGVLLPYEKTPLCTAYTPCRCKRIHMITVICTHKQKFLDIITPCQWTYMSTDYVRVIHKWKKHMKHHHGLKITDKLMNEDHYSTIDRIKMESQEKNQTVQQYMTDFIMSMYVDMFDIL